MLLFKDFVPEKLQEGGFFSDTVYEAFEGAVTQANQWIEQNGIRVMNVETVVLPNLHKSNEDGSTDPELRTAGDFPSYWHQFVRVWYQAD